MLGGASLTASATFVGDPTPSSLQHFEFTRHEDEERACLNLPRDELPFDQELRNATGADCVDVVLGQTYPSYEVRCDDVPGPTRFCRVSLEVEGMAYGWSPAPDHVGPEARLCVQGQAARGTCTEWLPVVLDPVTLRISGEFYHEAPDDPVCTPRSCDPGPYHCPPDTLTAWMEGRTTKASTNESLEVRSSYFIYGYGCRVVTPKASGWEDRVAVDCAVETCRRL